MGSKRPQKRLTGNKKGDKDENGQRSITEFTVKKSRDAVQKTTAKKTTVSGRAMPTWPSSGGKHIADDDGKALHDQVNELMRHRLALVNKPRGNASQDAASDAAAETTPAAAEASSSTDNFDGSKIQVCH